ncbi:cation-translocating P-type ATPase, partial [Patescibacteria group bacterium]
FLTQFKSPLVAIVLLAMAISLFIGHVADALFIGFVVLINSVVGFIQENKSEKALEKLSESVRFYCRVIRGGRKRRIESGEVVVGDVIEMQPGDKIPADGRIIESMGLKINEAALTGEWLSIEKSSEAIAEEKVISDQDNMAFMGTIVEDGSGFLLVTRVGIDTELGKISRLVSEEKEGKTVLQKKFYKLSQKMVVFILAAIVLFASVYILRGEDLYTVFITSIALVVSAVPEGLLPAVTIVLVLAMRRLSQKKALIRKLDATEGMGAISVICMDKTGTLTLGKMIVSHIITGAKDLLKEKGELEGIYDPKSSAAHLKALEIATLVNDAYIENPEDEIGEWKIQGRHTDKALLLAGINAGIDRDKLNKRYELLEQFQFNSLDKYAAHVFKSNGGVRIYFLGAPEVAIERSCCVDSDDDGKVSISSEYGKKLLDKVDELSDQGLRILACGWRELSLEEYEEYKGDKERLLKDISLIGFIALKDPLRKDAKKSVEIASRAGIRPVVITGDHRNTAKAIINELGINLREKGILEGKDVDRMTDDELFQSVENAVIFARVIPEHKIRIVKALQRRGEVVAMVGDGVNDAPALKAADIGVSMENGTDITKEVSDIVLLDESFSVIISAIEQGRLAKDNIRRILIYLLADDFSELFLFFVAIFMGLPFPLYPAQILWINLVEDGFPDMALTTESDTRGIMDRKPDNPNEPIISSVYRNFMFITFLVSGLAACIMFCLMYKFTGDLERVRTITFALIAFDSLIFAYVVKSFRESIFTLKTFSNQILNWSILIAFVLLLAGVTAPV